MLNNTLIDRELVATTTAGSQVVQLYSNPADKFGVIRYDIMSEGALIGTAIDSTCGITTVGQPAGGVEAYIPGYNDGTWFASALDALYAAADTIAEVGDGSQLRHVVRFALAGDGVTAFKLIEVHRASRPDGLPIRYELYRDDDVILWLKGYCGEPESIPTIDNSPVYAVAPNGHYMANRPISCSRYDSVAAAWDELVSPYLEGGQS